MPRDEEDTAQRCRCCLSKDMELFFQGLNSLCISTAASAEVLPAHLPDGFALRTQLLQGFLKSLNFLPRKSLHCAGTSLEASWTIPLEVVCRFTEENTDTLSLAALPGRLCQGRIQEHERNPGLEQKAALPVP